MRPSVGSVRLRSASVNGRPVTGVAGWAKADNGLATRAAAHATRRIDSLRLTTSPPTSRVPPPPRWATAQGVFGRSASLGPHDQKSWVRIESGL